MCPCKNFPIAFWLFSLRRTTDITAQGCALPGEYSAHTCSTVPAFATQGTHLAVGTDEKRLHFNAVVDHWDCGAGADRSCIAGGGGNDGVGHTSTTQRGWKSCGLSDTLWLAVGCLYMADGVVGSWEGRARVFDAYYGCLLEGGRLLGRLVSARGDWEAVWNQGLWPNLQTESQVLLGTWTNTACMRSPSRISNRINHGPGASRKTECSNCKYPAIHLLVHIFPALLN